MKQFISAVEEIEAEDEQEEGALPKGALEFELVKPDPSDPKDLSKAETRRLVAYRPSDGQLAVLMASSGRHSSADEQVGAAINFLVSCMDRDDARYIEDRLLDRHDKFEIEQVDEIMEWMAEEWSGGRPTKQRSGSAGSRRNTGRKSTQPTPV